MNEDFQGLCEEAEAWKAHFHEPGFLWRPQGKAGESREGIPRYVEQASRRLTKQKPENTIQKSGDDG